MLNAEEITRDEQLLCDIRASARFGVVKGEKKEPKINPDPVVDEIPMAEPVDEIPVASPFIKDFRPDDPAHYLEAKLG